MTDTDIDTASKNFVIFKRIARVLQFFRDQSGACCGNATPCGASGSSNCRCRMSSGTNRRNYVRRVVTAHNDALHCFTCVEAAKFNNISFVLLDAVVQHGHVPSRIYSLINILACTGVHKVDPGFKAQINYTYSEKNLTQSTPIT